MCTYVHIFVYLETLPAKQSNEIDNCRFSYRITRCHGLSVALCFRVRSAWFCRARSGLVEGAIVVCFLLEDKVDLTFRVWNPAD